MTREVVEFLPLAQDTVDELFLICVDIMTMLGDLTGLTYNEINVLVFCFIWPAHTLYLFFLSYRARRTLLKQSGKTTSRTRALFPFLYRLFNALRFRF
jgi:hypothetical protein